MTVNFTRFGDIELPQYNPQAQAGTRPALIGRVRTTDGHYFDRLGDKQAYQDGGVIALIGTYHFDHAHLSEKAYRDLMAMQGKSSWLYRQMYGTDFMTRIWARLEQVQYTPRVFNHETYFDIRLSFFVQDYCWNGQRWGDYELGGGAMRGVTGGIPGLPGFDSASFTATGGESSATVTLNNQGNVDVRGILIEVTGATSNMTGFTITDNLLYDLDYTATVGTTDIIRVDTMAKTVRDRDGLGMFANFALGGNHKRSDWLIVPPQGTDYTVSPYSGTFPAGVKIAFHFADGWQ